MKRIPKSYCCYQTIPSPAKSRPGGVELASKLESPLTNRMRKCGALLAAFTLVLSFTPAAWGHKVNVFAYVQGDKVFVEGYFGGNVKAQNSAVEVFDSDGKKILVGKTDSKGMYSFRLTDLPPVKGDMKIVLVAGMGHRSEYNLSADELPASAVIKGASGTGVQTKEPEIVRQTALPEAAPLSVQDASTLKKLVAEELDKKIQPVLKMLGEQQRLLMEQKSKGPGITEIVGGIGWIFGIVGVGAYLTTRKRNETKQS